MSRTLTAADRSALIRLASTMPAGSEGRRAILKGLSKRAGGYALSDLGEALITGMTGDDLVRMLLATKDGRTLIHRFFRDVLEFVGDYPQIDLTGGRSDIVGRGSGPTGHALRDLGSVVLGLRLDAEADVARVYWRTEDARGDFQHGTASLGSLDKVKNMDPKEIARRMIDTYLA